MTEEQLKILQSEAVNKYPDGIYCGMDAVIDVARNAYIEGAKAQIEKNKSNAVGFAEWIDGMEYECFLHTDENIKHWQHISGQGNHYITAELYSLYVNQK